MIGIRTADGHIAANHVQAIGSADNSADAGSATEKAQIAAVQGNPARAIDASNGFIPGQGQGTCVGDHGVIRQTTAIGCQIARHNRHRVGGHRARQQHRAVNRHRARARKRTRDRAAGQRLIARGVDRTGQQAARLAIGRRGQNARTGNRAIGKGYARLRIGGVQRQRAAAYRSGTCIRAKAATGFQRQAARSQRRATSIAVCAAQRHVAARYGEAAGGVNILDNARDRGRAIRQGQFFCKLDRAVAIQGADRLIVPDAERTCPGNRDICPVFKAAAIGIGGENAARGDDDFGITRS